MGPDPTLVRIGREIRRNDTLIRAVLNRIGRCGDMHIRIRDETFRRIIRCAGFKYEFDVGSYREIDAIALEALCALTKADHSESKP